MCDRCQYQLELAFDDPTEAQYDALPEVAYLYNPPCRCSCGTCWYEYLCEACATSVPKPQYLKKLVLAR